MRISMNSKPFRDHVVKMKRVKTLINTESRSRLNDITDRHLARVKKNTDVGDSPYSPTLRNSWDRSGVQELPDGVFSEVFNPTEYAPHYEYGHRQTPGRLVFIELAPGQQKYGQVAREIKKGKHQGKWGIYIRLKSPFVKGRFVMTDSEKKAQAELDTAVKDITELIRRGLR